MEDREAGFPRGALHTSFTHTANALASMYKQSLSAEREARDAGARSAYQNMMQWAARKPRKEGMIPVADIISFCATEITKMPQPSSSLISSHSLPGATNSTVIAQNPTERPSTRNNQSFNTNSLQRNSADMLLDPSSNPVQSQQHYNQDHSNVAYIARDESLVSEIKKLNVNPRKRQRIELSEAFLRACGTVDNPSFLFSDDCGYTKRSPDRASAVVVQTELMRRDNRESRDGAHFSTGTNEPGTVRHGKGSKSHSHDKQRKK